MVSLSNGLFRNREVIFETVLSHFNRMIVLLILQHDPRCAGMTACTVYTMKIDDIRSR